MRWFILIRVNGVPLFLVFVVSAVVDGFQIRCISYSGVFYSLVVCGGMGAPFSGSVGETHAGGCHSFLERSGAFALKFRSGQFFGSMVLALAAWMCNPEIFGTVGTQLFGAWLQVVRAPFRSFLVLDGWISVIPPSAQPRLVSSTDTSALVRVWRFIGVLTLSNSMLFRHWEFSLVAFSCQLS